MAKKLLIIFLLLFLFAPQEIFATFDMAIEGAYRTIDFGPMEMGEEKMLSERGGYHHQFNFTSDNGRRWQFKAQLIRPFTMGQYSIPAENFQWIAEELRNGQGTLSTRLSAPSPFASYPVLIYSSSGTDNTGTQVQIRLKYNLEIPQSQTAGAYTAHIRFTMLEEL